jgi:ribosome-associated protein
MKQIQFTLREGESFIPLIQLLKATHVVGSGSEAQDVVVEGMVLRNGTVELRKRAKIVDGDVIRFADFEIVVSNPS